MKKQEIFFCECCRKKFKNEVTYKTHLNSKKHKKIFKEFEKKAKLKQEQEEPEQATEDMTENEKILTTIDDTNICLFSNNQSENFEQ
jgi:predicted ribosome-associated RNA-binding protein Tma20